MSRPYPLPAPSQQAQLDIRHVIYRNVSMRRVAISILVPFQAGLDDQRTRIFDWTRRYMRWFLPDAEIIVGQDPDTPFSKSVAVNDAASRARGKMYVILDADAYLDINIMLITIDLINLALREGRNLWYVPYRNFYRLTESATERVLDSSPLHPYSFPHPPDPDDIEHNHPPNYGHHYGAMALIMPADAFWTVGGMDTRFRGWGSEDISFMFAVDTLWGAHKTLDADIFHLWHPRIGSTFKETMWPGQKKPLQHHILGSRYAAANRDYKRMRALVDEDLNGETKDSPGL